MRRYGTLLLLALAASSQAWDAAGHELVVQIAMSQCSATTAKKVRKLLKSVKGSVVVAGNSVAYDYREPVVGARFADDILYVIKKNPFEKTNYKNWHFIDLEEAHFDDVMANWPPTATKKTVIEGINDAQARIKGQSATGFPKGKAEALLFLLHFVGDIHQPLHCTDNNDSGGHYDVKTSDGHTIQPHPVWDGEATKFYHLDGAKGTGTASARAAALDQIKSAADNLAALYGPTFTQAQVSDLDPFDWAKESFDYGKHQIYDAATPLSVATMSGWQDFALRRITLAGLRLGKLLDKLAPSL